jgi:hypothetical protein
MPSSKNLRWATESRGCSCFVFRNLDGGKHSAVHSLESNQVASGIGYRYVHFPISLLRLCHCGLNNRLGSVERYRKSIGHIEGYLVWDEIERIGRYGLCFMGVCWFAA